MSDSILVLGAGGFVGRHLVQALASRGEKVLAVSRRATAPEPAMPGIEHVLAATADPAWLLPLVARSRIVVHLASGSTPGSSAGQPLAELHGSLQLTLALLEALQQRPQTSLLYLSSGGSLYRATPDTVVDEGATVAPRSYHGAGKVAAEHFISAWCSQYAGAATIVRPSNLYGPGQLERAGFGIVPAGFGKMLRDETLVVWGDGSATRDYLFIDDFVALCTAILGAPMREGALALNASSGVGVSLNELFTEMETVAGKVLLRTYDPGRAVDAARVVMDAAQARRLFGWTPGISLHEGLKRTWDRFTTIPR
ncbi:MAG: NAD-dependent epimerase/dehydratase family protein [Rhodanobacter sp.]